MKKTTATLSAALAVSALGNAFLLGARAQAPASAPTEAQDIPYGAHELIDPDASAFATKLLDGAKPIGMICEKIPGGPEKTLCSDGALGRWISDAAAKAIGVEVGTIAIGIGPGGKVYVR